MINLKKNDALADAVKEILQQEALKGNQHLIDKNKNNKVDPEDFKILRGEKKTVKEEETVDEGIKDIAKKAFKALTGGSDEDQRKDLQRKMGLPQTGKKPEPQKEEVEQIDEKNVPTSPEKWARAKAAAKSKFAVYPSAYANGWASKKYKSMGGGWRATSEEVMSAAPTNAVGTGNIAGSGGAGGEPGVSKKRNPLMSFYKRKPPKM